MPSRLIRRILVIVAAAACFALLAITQPGRSDPAGAQLIAALLPAPGLGTGTGYCAAYPGADATKYNLDNVYACDGSTTGNTTFDQPGKGMYAWQCVELSARFLWAVHRIWAGPGSGVQDGADLVSVVHANNKQIPVATPGPASVPGVGDVISLGPGGGSDPTYGHTAVVVGANPVTGQFTIMSENDPLGEAGEQPLQVDLGGGHNGQVLYHNNWTAASWLVLAPVTLPAEPTSLSASWVTGSSAVLHWADSANNVGQYLTQYKIGNGIWTSGPSAPAGATSVSVGGLRTGTIYTFQVGARNAKGTRWSGYLRVKTVSIPAEPTVGKPAMAARDATISWEQTASNEAEFLTQYKLGSGAWRAGPSVGSGTRSVTIGGLIPGEPYTFQVGAKNIAGTRWSAYATGSTPQVLASQVTNARVTATSETVAALAWTNTADNVASFVTQYRVTGTSAWTTGPSVGAATTSVTVAGLKAGTEYTFQVGAKNSKGTNWGQYFYGTTASAPAPAPAPTGYNTGHQVTVVSQATGGVSGHKGPANSYAAGPTHPANSPIWLVCYVNGQSITGPYGTETVWDLGDDGYYYSDAWLWTDSNGPVVPACDLKTVTVVSQATGGDSGHTGPSNAYSAGPARAAGSDVQIACYVSGQSIVGPYGTESVWDLSTDGYYYSDAWLWTNSNGPVVPACP